jgi:hypothetical protein
LEWFSESGEPNKKRVERIIERLSKMRPVLVKKDRNKWILTEDGKVIARKAALRFVQDEERRKAKLAQPMMI